MNNLHDSVSFYHTENVEKTISFAYISTLENVRILNFVLQDASFKALQKLYGLIPIENQKCLPNIFNMMETDTVIGLFILSMRKAIRTGKK